jgi:hypothetical protein
MFRYLIAGLIAVVKAKARPVIIARKNKMEIAYSTDNYIRMLDYQHGGTK